jgi:hypothetical protein
MLLVAGCGGSKGSSTTASTAAKSTTTVSANGSTTAPTFSGSKNSKYCDLARQFDSAVSSPITSDPKALFQQFDTFSAQFLAVVPGQIKTDAETVINALKQLETAYKAANYDATKVDPSALSALTDPKFKAAADRIDAYDSEVCGITTTSAP